MHSLGVVTVVINSGHPVRNAKAATRVAPPDKGTLLADDVAGAAFKASVIDEGHLLIGLRPAVAACRAGGGAGPIAAPGAYLLVEEDVRFSIDGETGEIEEFVKIHKALQALTASAMIFFRPTVSLMLCRASFAMSFLGEPSMP